MTSQSSSSSWTTDNESMDPVQVVRAYLDCVDHSEFAQAARLLHEHVQMSYPGMPFIKSVSDWYCQAIRHPRAFLLDTHNSSSSHCRGWREAPHLGAHSHQVVRRSRCTRHGALIEVFEVGYRKDDQGRVVPCIASMYLRKAPCKWTTNKHRRRPGRRQRGRFQHPKKVLWNQVMEEDSDFGDDAETIQEDNTYFRLRKGNFIH